MPNGERKVHKLVVVKDTKRCIDEEGNSAAADCSTRRIKTDYSSVQVP